MSQEVAVQAPAPAQEGTQIASAPLTPPYVGAFRTFKPPACRLSRADLKVLFRLLSQKAGEVTARVVAELPEAGPQGQTREDMTTYVRDLLLMRASIEGTRGEQVSGVSDPAALDEDQLTFHLKRITFDNSSTLKARFNNFPDNWVRVQLDFDTPPLFDLSNLSNEPTPNESLITVAGKDTTWVTGVFTELQHFFDSRRKHRGWLHAKQSYDLLLMFVGLPFTFRLLHFISRGYGAWLTSLAPTLSVAVYIYLFFVFLYVFRISFGIVRWLYPLVELEGTRSRTRVAVTAFLAVVTGALTLDIVKGLIVAAAKSLATP